LQDNLHIPVVLVGDAAFRYYCRNSWQRGVNASLQGVLIIGSMDHPLPHRSLSDNTSNPQKLTELTIVTLLEDSKICATHVRLLTTVEFAIARRRGCDKKE
jgi:hypothetical protein